MKKYSDLEYLRLPKMKRFLYTLMCVICGIPGAIWNGIKAIGNFFVKCGKAIVNEFVDIGLTWKNGDAKTRLSFFVMGLVASPVGRYCAVFCSC